jgi:hypothetical protein
MYDAKLIETANALVKHCQDGTEAEALNTLYADDCVSIEALDMPGGPMGREASGLEAIRAKHDWWFANNEVHHSGAEGPFLYAPNTFSVIFDMDVTDKSSGQRMAMKEVGVYTLNDEGKIVREEFMYPPMPEG